MCVEGRVFCVVTALPIKSGSRLWSWFGQQLPVSAIVETLQMRKHNLNDGRKTQLKIRHPNIYTQYKYLLLYACGLSCTNKMANIAIRGNYGWPKMENNEEWNRIFSIRLYIGLRGRANVQYIYRLWFYFGSMRIMCTRTRTQNSVFFSFHLLSLYFCRWQSSPTANHPPFDRENRQNKCEFSNSYGKLSLYEFKCTIFDA